MVEAQAKTPHQVAELYTQHDELQVRRQDVEKELDNQRNRSLKARSEVMERRESLSQAEQIVETLRQEAALEAASVPLPQVRAAVLLSTKDPDGAWRQPTAPTPAGETGRI